MQIPLDGPEAIITLETPDGEAVEVQTIRLWDPGFVAQIRPVGRETEELVERLLPGEQVAVDGPLRLVNGANVTIRPATPESTAAAPPRG